MSFRQGRRRRKKLGERFKNGAARGIHLLPTMVTLANLSCGFASILFALDGKFEMAAYLIIFSMVADTLDGALARVARATSRFGAELDSLSDIVSFGVAPALLLHQRFGLDAHPLWLFPLFYVICGAIRLARFNIQDGGEGTIFFRGTPIPAAAGVVIGLVLALKHYGVDELPKVVVILLVFTLSYLMVSNIKYPSAKRFIDPSRPRPFGILVIALLVALLLAYRPVETWLILISIYYLSGPVMGIREWFRSGREGVIEEGTAAP